MLAHAPQTIDDVLVSLNLVLDDALRTGARIGYFAALYERVTSNVRRAIVAGTVFDDNARMTRLDVVFANRFLDAWDQHHRGEQPSACWQVAFAALDDSGPLVLQHLLLGMNAHINLDLGIAAATVAPTPQSLEALWPDFMKISEVLARLTRVVEDELCQICPRLQRAADLVTVEDRLFSFGIDKARDLAWAFASQLVATPQSQWKGPIKARDDLTAAAGRALYPLHGLAGGVVRSIHEDESTDIRFNIQVVAE